MFNKTWKEMRDIDISEKVEKRDGMEYLNWAKCIEILHEEGAEEVYFTPCVNANGSSLFMSDVEIKDDKGVVQNRCYEVRIKVVIDEKKFEMQFPLMNGKNPVRDNSLSQLRVSNAQARAFVKGVAIHIGLGFGLWSKYERESYEKELKFTDLYKIKEQAQELYSAKWRESTTAEIAKALGMTEDSIKAHFSYFDMLVKFTKELGEL